MATFVSKQKSASKIAYKLWLMHQTSSGMSSNKTTHLTKNILKETLFIENDDGDGNGQTSVWLIEGIADFVRLKANYILSHWVQPGQGDRWEQRFDVTARFLEYYDGLRNGFVAELNKKMRSGYNAGYVVELLGKTS
ncbi:hypothetical protein J1N35_043019 [Gossypium stocksii]|uniref:Uncharacterized protein n=1 Tax=Gossypium stocksii TaxID=47602 RepID=A0A9D3ZEN6_9ROSI|nr:hypothetical protein J1N35_043019 [Gossypium stocksii]